MLFCRRQFVRWVVRPVVFAALALEMALGAPAFGQSAVRISHERQPAAGASEPGPLRSSSREVSLPLPQAAVAGLLTLAGIALAGYTRRRRLARE